MPKGITARTRKIINESYKILQNEYPMTLRQLFYRLVSKQLIDNNRSSYQKLSRILTRARNEGEILFEWIVDRSKPDYQTPSWKNPEEYIKAVSRSYHRNYWQDQPYYVEVWLEKDTLAGTLEPIKNKYGVMVRAHRGYSSTTKKNEIANMILIQDKPVHVLYLGDFDPSGEDIERDLEEQINSYLKGYGEFQITRLAILKADISSFNLPPLRVKESDSRTKSFKKKYGEECVEVDALPPNELRSRVEDAIMSYIDFETWNRQVQVEKVEMESIREIASRWKEL